VDTLTLDRLLRRAIAAHRLVSFRLSERDRIAEPHDYGIHNGRLRLFFYQIGGASSSNEALGWRWADLEKISQLELLEDTFGGARATPSGQHIAWHRLYASVSRPDEAYDARSNPPGWGGTDVPGRG
jgi:hypothetical protein